MRLDPLKLYELDVDIRVRRTMRVRALNPDTAKAIAYAYLSLAANGRAELSSVLKWTDGRQAYRPMPVEKLLLAAPPVLGEPVEVPP